jgi:tRNA (adenine22-N1)-methyltransferase
MYPRPLKISKRLETIAAMVYDSPAQPWDHIWDCCCDHGHLGMTLLQQNTGPNIHFVDIVPAIMAQLTAKLERFFTQKQPTRWHVHCIDVAALPIEKFDGSKKHLVIIAGVGGEQTVAMVEQLLTHFTDHQLEFLLCPLRHQFKLRLALQAMNLGLVDECLIKENKRFYEIIHVSNGSSITISPVGSRIWHNRGQLELDYLEQTLSHYRRIGLGSTQDGSAPDVNSIIAAYEQLKNWTQDTKHTVSIP